VDECISAGVWALRERLREEPPESIKLPSQAEVAAVVDSIKLGIGDAPVPRRRTMVWPERPPVILTEEQVKLANEQAAEIRARLARIADETAKVAGVSPTE